MMLSVPDTPIRFSFPQQEQSPDGQLITKNTYMDAYFIERSQLVFDELQRASKLNAEGSNQECLNILMQLYEQKRIIIQQADIQPPYTGYS